MKSVTQGGLDPESIQVPMMFYVIVEDGRKLSLFLIRFDAESGSFRIHQAGKAKKMTSTDIATSEFLSLFDQKYAEVVAPILREVFSSEVESVDPLPSEKKKTVQPNSALDVCLSAAFKLKVKRRHGVYFGVLLKEPLVSSWLKSAGRAANKEDFKIELEKCGMSSSPVAFTTKDEAEIDLSIRDYIVDFDFYMK